MKLNWVKCLSSKNFRLYGNYMHRYCIRVVADIKHVQYLQIHKFSLYYISLYLANL